MLNVILNHKSIRKYKPDVIPEKDLNSMLEAASRASTTGNMQVYSIITTTDQVLKSKLWEVHFKQNMVNESPAVVTFCADYNRFSKWCLQRNASPGYNNYLSFFTGAIDALLAAQNYCIAAESLGYGICYLGTTTYNAKKIIEILELPKLVVPITTIVVGIPNENPDLTDRLPIQGIAHKNKYHNYSEDSINNIFEGKENMPFYQELLKTNNKETLAQIFTDLRYTKKDNEFFSKEFLEAIEQQGFIDIIPGTK